jgi:hypothetical protein
MNNFLSIIHVFIFLLFISCEEATNTRFIEAENFETKGGWVVDPQFSEQMGSPYLLAHGLGTPVDNARTSFRLPGTGTYHVWVRTMNWVPGEWQAPGRFKVIVNDHELETELGTEPGWNWQYAGQVNITEKSVKLALKDLTGFDARCDAVYFSKTKQSPPNEAKRLKQWRKKQRNESDIPGKSQHFDLVIVGGGIAGCAAAIASAEQGMNVALIHDRPVPGGNASSEIRVHTLGITWYYDRILKKINTAHWPNGDPNARKDEIKRQRNISAYNNISLFYNWRAFATNTENDSITSVDARHTSNGKKMRFTAPLFVDCTGDGWIGYWAGAEYLYGREPADKYDESWEKHGELWSPQQADNRVMGSSVLWRTKDTGQPVDFPKVPWAIDVAEGHAAIHGEWYWEFSKDNLHQINDAEKIRDHMLRAIYGSFYNAKQNPENANLTLEWVSYLVGKRESRRLVGDYIYTFPDVRDMKEFLDSVVKEKRAVDVHYQRFLVEPEMPDFLSEALFYRIDHYYIPYRCLYSKNIKNLFMAGRCFSCSHIGLGGPRVMNTTGQMGVAVGYAASLCKKHNINPRGIYRNYIDELKTLIVNCSKNTSQD